MFHTQHENQVKVRIIGKRELLPERLRRLAEKIERETEKYNKHVLNVALAYGGRQEIVDAIKQIALDVKEGRIKIEDITPELVSNYLYTDGLPDPDLILRTSGEERISNFLLYQIAYSELLFLDVYWPDFRKIDLLRAIRIYQQRNRRFGR